VLKSVATDPTERIGSVALLSPDEERQILLEWNATDRAIPDTPSWTFFETQATTGLTRSR